MMGVCHHILSPLTEFKERNAKVALKWAELTEEERKQWALKAEAVCASSIQEYIASAQPAPLGLSSLLSPSMSSDLSTGSLVEKALLGIQEKVLYFFIYLAAF